MNVVLLPVAWSKPPLKLKAPLLLPPLETEPTFNSPAFKFTVPEPPEVDPCPKTMLGSVTVSPAPMLRMPTPRRPMFIPIVFEVNVPPLRVMVLVPAQYWQAR